MFLFASPEPGVLWVRLGKTGRNTRTVSWLRGLGFYIGAKGVFPHGDYLRCPGFAKKMFPSKGNTEQAFLALVFRRPAPGPRGCLNSADTKKNKQSEQARIIRCFNWWFINILRKWLIKTIETKKRINSPTRSDQFSLLNKSVWIQDACIPNCMIFNGMGLWEITFQHSYKV